MSNIFGRPTPDSCQHVCRHLDAFCGGTCPIDQAIGENLQCDDRVTDARGQIFLDSLATTNQPNEIFEQLELNRTQRSGTEFCDTAINGSNIIDLNKLKHTTEEEFVNVRKVSPALREKVCGLLRKSNPELADIGIAEDIDELDYCLEEQRAVAMHSTVQKSVAEALNTLADKQKEASAKQLSGQLPPPTWVGLLSEFKNHVEHGPERWIRVFGLGHFFHSRSTKPNQTQYLFLLLRYQCDSAGTVARPSVLDAGSNPWHYPTPAAWPPEQGGRCVMLVNNNSIIYAPVREYIHNSRIIGKEDVVCLRPLDLNTVVIPNESDARARHKQWLDTQP